MDDWNVTTLKEHFDKVFQEHELRYGQRFEAQEHAHQEFKETIGERFESVNKFRESLRDQLTTTLPRTEYDRAHGDLVHQVQTLNSRMDRRDGEKTGSTDVWGYVVGAMGIVIGIASIVFALTKH